MARATMNTERIVNRLTDFVLRFYHRQWEQWEVLALGLVALFLIVMAVKARREVAANKKHVRERTARMNN